MQRIAASLVSTFLSVGIVLLGIAAPAMATADPFDWYTQAHTDLLNYEATGPRGDAWTVANIAGGYDWRNTFIMSDQYASVTYPGQYFIQDNKLAKYGDDTWNCTTEDCRNHGRIWGIPYRDSTDSIQTISTEHLYGCCTHVVDSFNNGRDGFFWDIWPFLWVRYGWWTQKYASGCIGQPDGSCAPFDGQVAYEYISDQSSSPASAPKAGSTAVPSSSTTSGHGTYVKPDGDSGDFFLIPPPPATYLEHGR